MNKLYSNRKMNEGLSLKTLKMKRIELNLRDQNLLEMRN